MRLLTTVAIALVSFIGLTGCHSIRSHHIGAGLGSIGASGCADGNCDSGCATGDCGKTAESNCGCGSAEGCDGSCSSSNGLLGNLIGARPLRGRLQGVGCGALGCGIGGRLCGRCQGLGLRRTPPVHPYGGQAPCSQPLAGPQGPISPTVGYPYYTTRGPRDFFLSNPPSLGR